MQERVQAAFETSCTLKQFQKKLSSSSAPSSSSSSSSSSKKSAKDTSSPFLEFSDKPETNANSNFRTRMKQLEKILSYDSLTSLEDQEKRFLWQERHLLVSRPEALSKYLLSVNWQDHKQVNPH